LDLTLLFYYLKKIISFFLMPVPLLLALLALSRLGRWILLANFAALLIASNMTFSRLILSPLEFRYAAIPEINSPADIPADLAECTAIIVLGSGHSDDPALAASTKLCESALGRIVEGVRIARSLPQAMLITSGPSEGDRESHGSVLSRCAQLMGVSAQRIRVIDSAHDTHDEVMQVKQIVKHGKVALVTSAFHMPRAVALFRKQGLDVVPCPADYKGKRSPVFSFLNNLWDADSLSRTTIAVHEYLGIIWSRLRGQL
jgi:uncharacterized SAM-binding protein YcdF (DUF218 family)